MKDFAVVILGPTCTGKTEIALEISYKIGEIISVDSMQVYKYMNIGTAKPSKEELIKVKHHLIDIITPDRQFTAGEFNRRAKKLIP
ncbi:MAG: tRNA dimethylallyltransferase, partial [Spirochaetes bacterium]|nr:tRNA dimethylallyltransferase [Spirochaetota bacterium]